MCFSIQDRQENMADPEFGIFLRKEVEIPRKYTFKCFEPTEHGFSGYHVQSIFTDHSLINELPNFHGRVTEYIHCLVNDRVVTFTFYFDVDYDYYNGITAKLVPEDEEDNFFDVGTMHLSDIELLIRLLLQSKYMFLTDDYPSLLKHVESVDIQTEDKKMIKVDLSTYRFDTKLERFADVICIADISKISPESYVKNVDGDQQVAVDCIEFESKINKCLEKHGLKLDDFDGAWTAEHYMLYVHSSSEGRFEDVGAETEKPLIIIIPDGYEAEPFSESFSIGDIAFTLSFQGSWT